MRLHILLLLAASLACGGGGGDDPYNESPTEPGNSPNTPNTPAPSAASIEMTSSDDGYGGASHAFSPTRVTIARGGTVTWNNSSGIVHNATFSSSASGMNVPNLGAGSASRTFPSAGTFSYSCTNHSGMSGQVVVQ